MVLDPLYSAHDPDENDTRCPSPKSPASFKISKIPQRRVTCYLDEFRRRTQLLRSTTGYEGGFRCPAMIRWPGHVPAGKTENGIISGLDWFPTFVAAAGDPNIKEELMKGKQIGDRTYKNYLDSYNQLDMITGKGPSARHEVYYFAESNLAAVRIDDFKYQFITQPDGWTGAKVHPDTPSLVNLRLDPFERTLWPGDGTMKGSLQYFSWFQYEFWRYVFVQQEVAKLAKTAFEYPPMQKGASFNLDAVKEKIADALKAQQQ